MRDHPSGRSVGVMTERLARACSNRPGRVIAVWLVAVLASFPAIGLFLGDVLTADVEVTAETESQRADELLDRAFPQSRAEDEREITEVVVVRAARGNLAGPAARERLAELAGDLRAAGATAAISSSEGRPLVSADGDARAVLVALGLDGEDDVPGVYEVVQRLDDQPGYEAAITGELSSEADEEELSGEDLRAGELLFGLPAALVILLLVFGAVVAGLMPLILALVSIFVALALAGLLGQAYGLSLYTVNMLSGMGLALGVDYSLFVVSRYREERSRGREPLDAIGATGATASRAVLFSGITFVLAMFGLVLVPSTIFRSLAAGAILVGIVSVLVAVTLLPAILGLLGDRINAGRIPFFGRAAAQAGTESRFWGAIAHAVMRRPVASLVATGGLLLALALPALGLETGSQGPSALPDRFESRQGYVLLNEEFPAQTTDPVQIAVAGDADSPGVQSAIERLDAELARRPRFAAPAVQASNDGDVTRISVPIGGDPVGEPAVEAVRELRADVIPRAFARADAEVLVTGDTAEELDYHETVDAWVAPVFAFVLGLSFVLLTIAFRSIVVPIKAIVLNLLSVGAAYGLLVLVFQEGIGNELLGLDQAENVAAWVPLFLFAVLFGLSMDYQVFLLSRIRERYQQTGDSDEAVAYGVGSTARLITGAALIIIAVFWGFAMGDLIMFQQMGFGVAVALLIDATIVRAVLVPAGMKLLGAWNWYLPGWLSWLPAAHVEGPGPAAPRAPSP
jgi:putative drug exporter of the RND superfamily